MIFDNIKNAEQYYGLGENFRQAFRIMKTLNENSPLGRVDVSENLYYTVMQNEGRSPDNLSGENHKNYADIQFLLSGREKMGFCQYSRTDTIQPYSSEKDIEIVTGDFTLCEMEKRDFMIFFPQDSHAPGINVNGKPFLKAVFKVRLN